MSTPSDDDTILRAGPVTLICGLPELPKEPWRPPPSNSTCRTGCPTQDHASWGECARAANMRVAYCGIGGGDATAQKKWDTELSLYRQARKQGIQPDGTKTNQIMRALKASDKVGAAYGRDFGKAAAMPEGA